MSVRGLHYCDSILGLIWVILMIFFYFFLFIYIYIYIYIYIFFFLGGGGSQVMMIYSNYVMPYISVMILRCNNKKIIVQTLHFIMCCRFKSLLLCYVLCAVVFCIWEYQALHSFFFKVIKSFLDMTTKKKNYI